MTHTITIIAYNISTVMDVIGAYKDRLIDGEVTDRRNSHVAVLVVRRAPWEPEQDELHDLRCWGM
jgi:hypothetical protein